MGSAAATTEARENVLVARAQAGDREAFEALFRRYREKIAAYVGASVRDEGRSEDLVQEIFLAAHSRLPTLEQPGAFRGWLYQIARNACLDEARRRSRQEDLIHASEEFPPPDERIVVHIQSPERAFSQKEELASLTQALDGLPKAQHDALVLRELEGRSYDEIGRRMQLSRPAVESVLFRARRGFKGEYSEITTGRRCRRMQGVMAAVAEGMGDLRERRRLIRHMRACVSCRREAAALGLAGLAVPSEDRRGLERAFSRIAASLPLPAFFGRRAGETEPLSQATGSFTVQAQGAVAQLSTVAGDHVVSAVHKAAAVVAAVAVVGGGGVAVQTAGVHLPVRIPGLDAIAANPHHGKSDRTAGAARDGLPPTASRSDEAGRAKSPASAAPSAPATHPEGTADPATEPQPPGSTDQSTDAAPDGGEPAGLDALTPSPSAPADPADAGVDPTPTGGADPPAVDPPAADPTSGPDASVPPADGGATIPTEPDPGIGGTPPTVSPPSDGGTLGDPVTIVL